MPDASESVLERWSTAIRGDANEGHELICRDLIAGSVSQAEGTRALTWLIDGGHAPAENVLLLLALIRRDEAFSDEKLTLRDPQLQGLLRETAERQATAKGVSADAEGLARLRTLDAQARRRLDDVRRAIEELEAQLAALTVSAVGGRSGA
jgi:hypothetical protein